MATASSQPLDERQVQGVRLLKPLVPLLKQLHSNGCQRDKAGNRELHFDQYCLLILLYFFNPLVTSLRSIQQASQLRKVQKRLGVARASLGSLSEAARVFDPEALRAVARELAHRLPTGTHDARLSQLQLTLTAVDGTLLRTLPTLVERASLVRPRSPDGWRLHTQFEILRGVPARMDLTTGRNRGATNEKRVLRAHLQSDHCYVMDRGYEQFSLFNAIVDARSSYVCRLRPDRHFTADTTLALTAEAQAAGVVADEIGQLGSEKSQRIERPHHRVRRLRLVVPLHPRRQAAGEMHVVLVTNLLDVPAEIMALIYRCRWSIELFFRFFKHVLGCRHLLSEDPRGIEIQTYCALIACLLISLTTGHKPTLRTYEMVCYYFLGIAAEDELLAHLQKLPAPAL